MKLKFKMPLFPQVESVILRSQWFNKYSSHNGELLPHQQDIVNFMSPETPYRSLLVTYKVGSGKTFAAAALAHKWCMQGKPVKFISFSVASKLAFESAYKSYVYITGSTNKFKKIETIGSIQYSKMESDNCKVMTLYIIDEVHSIRHPAKVFKVLSSRFKSMDKARFLLLTGTPIVDKSREISDLRTICDEYTPVLDLDEYESNVKVIYEGNIDIKINGSINDQSYYRTDTIKIFSREITQNQLIAFNKLENKQNNFSIPARQIFTAVDEEGRYGSNIPDNPVKIHSSKFDAVIECLKRDQITVVYCEFISMSGIKGMCFKLEEIGFEKWKSNKNYISDKIRRYAVIIGDNEKKETKKCLNIFNSIENNHGSIIEVLIVSKALIESITLNNVSNLHVLTPHWNMKPLEQIIGRCTRNNSHIGIKNNVVKVYLHVCTINGSIENEIHGSDIKIIMKADEKKYKANETLKLINGMSLCGYESDLFANIDENNIIKSINDKKLIIEHAGIFWDVENCLDSNPRVISYMKFYRDKAKYYEKGIWKEKPLTNCIKIIDLNKMDDPGPFFIRFKIDNKVRLVYKENGKTRRRGRLLSLLDKDQIRDANKLLETGSIILNSYKIEELALIKNKVIDQICIDCTCAANDPYLQNLISESMSMSTST